MDESRDLGGKLKINGKTYAIYGGLNMVGRNKEANVDIKSLSVSQHHAIFILVDDDLHFISDLKSSNGTFLDGQPLMGLQLYRIRNGSRVKFADIEGIYSQCTSEDPKHISPNYSQCTQNYTESFYGTDTQIINDSCVTNNHNKTVRTQNSSYIPTQVLINVATRLETSYEKVHEQPTQIVLESKDIHEMPTQRLNFQKFHKNSTQLIKNKLYVPENQSPDSTQITDLMEKSVCELDQSVVDFHEAETQKVTLDDKCRTKNTFERSINGLGNESDYHEMETQLLPSEENVSRSRNNKPKNDSTCFQKTTNITENNVECQDINQEHSVEKTNISNTSSKTSLETNKIEEKDTNFKAANSNTNTVGSCTSGEKKYIQASSMRSLPDVNFTQDSDQVNPLGMSRNIFASQNSVDQNLSDTDYDIIRLVKKPIVAFNSLEDTLVDKHDSDREVRDEESNDSLDFMTMQKISDKHLEENNAALKELPEKLQVSPNEVEEKLNKTESWEGPKEGHTGAYIAQQFTIVSKVTSSLPNTIEKQLDNKSETSDSETDIENEVIEKNTSQEEDSETDNEKETNDLSTDNKRTNEKSINSDSETDIEMKKDEHDSENNDKPASENTFPCLKNKYSSTEKAEMSDSDTDNERQINENISASSKQKNKITIRRRKKNTNIMLDSESDIDTDFENEKERESIIGISKIINSSNFNGNAFQGEERLIDETRFEEVHLEHSVVPNVNLELGIKEDNIKNKNLLGINESLNDSDIIPATQECVPVRSISQNSKFENSEESFRLGLTQLMEDDTEEIGTMQEKSWDQKVNILKKINKTADKVDLVEKVINNNISDGNQKPIQNNSENSEEVRKKFVFKKTSTDTSKRANISLDFEEERYEAKTQTLSEETGAISDNINDDHVFLQPSQKLSKKKVSTEKSVPEEEIYLLCTQKFDGSTSKCDNEDIYLQSTQKLTSENLNNHDEETGDLWLADEDTHQQKPQTFLAEAKEHTPDRVEQDDDLNDMFATQTMLIKTTPKKGLETELEFMFATQKAIPTEESLDKIQDIVFQKPIDNSKLPEQDSDLEAILSTQKFSDSPKIEKLPEKPKTDEIMLGRSIESQLEVLFHSQSANLPPDKFIRPANPLVNIFDKTTQETELVISEKNTETSKESNEETSFLRENKSCKEISNCSNLSNERISQNGLEQSFALLQAKSTKIRRSARNANCEEVTVSCPKSRNSMAIALNEKFDKALEEEESKLIKGRKKKTTIKRQTSTSSESNFEMKESKRGRAVVKKRKTSESSVSEDVVLSNVSSNLTRSIRSRTSKCLENIDEIQDDDFEIQGMSGNKFKRKFDLKDETTDTTFHTRRSTRTNKKLVEEEENLNINSNDEKVCEPLTVISNNKTIISNVVPSKNNKGNNKTNSEKGTSLEISTKNQDKSRTEDKQNIIPSDSSSLSINKNETGYSSRTTKRGSDIVVSTPSKTRKRTLPSTPSAALPRVLENQDSPSRNKRKQKMKVVFTMMDNPQLESVIRLLGGCIVDSVETCTVLITPSLKRSMKLLSAVGLGKPICSPKWVEDSKKQNQFLDPWDYLLIDKEAEAKWDFSLRVSLERSLLAKLFEGYTFQLLVTSALDVLKGAIECSGGKIVTRTPKDSQNFILVASADHKQKYKKLHKQQPNLIIVEPEAIFDGVLRQEIRLKRHLLK